MREFQPSGFLMEQAMCFCVACVFGKPIMASDLSEMRKLVR
jgi:hypothetical protein